MNHGGLSLNKHASKNKGAHAEQNLIVGGKPASILYTAGNNRTCTTERGLLHAQTINNCGMQKCIAQHRIQNMWLHV